jgi:hypothetical protein
MGFLKRKNKKFKYSPIFYEGEGNPYKIEHKFDKFRNTVGANNGLKSKFTNVIEEFKVPQNKNSVRIMFIVIAVLLFVFLYIIDFDLSIFSLKK